MKYLAFFVVILTCVPLMAFLSGISQQWKRLLLALLIMSPMFGSYSKINFVSMEDYRGPDRGYEVTLTDIIAAGLALGLLYRYARSGLDTLSLDLDQDYLRRRQNRITWIPYNSVPLFAFFVCCAASLTYTPVLLYSSFSVFKLIRLGLIYWVVVNCIHDRADVRSALWGWTIAGLLMTYVTGMQKYVYGIYRVPGPFDHSNTVPLYLNFALAPVLMWGLVDTEIGTLTKVASLFSALGMLFAVISTFSRAGLALSLGAFAATIVIAVVRMPSKRSFATALVVLALGVAGGLKAAPRIIERFEDAPEESEEARAEFNRAAWGMASDDTFGVGINAFSDVMTNNERYRQHVVVMAEEQSAGVAHNIYLLTAAELGYPGLVVFLLVLGGFLWIAIKTSLRPASLESTMAAAVAIGMVCVHLQGFLEWAFRITPVTYQFILFSAFAVGLYNVATETISPNFRAVRHILPRS